MSIHTQAARAKPDFTFEDNMPGHARICGIDEAGRGPLAGPVVAAAVIFKDRNSLPDSLLNSVTDSKLLKPTQRRALYDQIYAHAHVGVGEASVDEIDQINILQATFLAMTRALEALDPAPEAALIDGNKTPPGITVPAQAVVKGDRRSLSIAAASIIAKTHRDNIMESIGATYPEYGWARNAGYGTKAHMAALQSLGATPHHRKSFAPVSQVLSVTY